MAVILDTTALSAFAEGDPRLGRAIANEMDLALPSIVLGEYLFGIRQSHFRSRYESWLRAHSATFLPLSSDGGTLCRNPRGIEVRRNTDGYGTSEPGVPRCSDLTRAALAERQKFVGPFLSLQKRVVTQTTKTIVCATQ